MKEYHQVWAVIPKHIFDLPDMTIQLLRFYETIFQFWNNGAQCFLTNSMIKKRTGIKSDSTISEYFQYFESKGLMIRKIINGKRYIIQNNQIQIDIQTTENTGGGENTPPRHSETPPLATARHNNNKIKTNKKIIATSSEVSTTGQQKTLKSNTKTRVNNDDIDVQPYIEAWNEIAAKQGSPRMGINKRQIQAVKRNLQIIKEDWECKLTIQSFKLWLEMAIKSNFYMITKDEYQKTMDVVTRWPHFYEAFNKGKKILENAQ